MLKPAITILLVFIFALTSVTNEKDEPGTDFQLKVEQFIQKHAVEFTERKETIRSGGNDFVLDQKAKSSWNQSVTLKSKTAFRNESGQEMYQRFFLGFYQYETDEQCAAALDSLLNCFGSDCQKIKWDENGKSAKTTPAIYLVNAQEIIVCKIHCERKSDSWSSFKQDLTQSFGRENSRIIETDCGGPVNFRKL